MKLDNLGNVRSFENPSRLVKPIGLITTPNLILKSYDMYTENPSEIETIVEMENFLKQEIKKQDIYFNAGVGLGFAILSKDMLNVVGWSKEYPIVAINSLYSFSEEKRDVLNSKKVSIDVFGSYCIWELGIVNHEKETWKEYLASQRTRKDKIKYLENTIEGEL